MTIFWPLAVILCESRTRIIPLTLLVKKTILMNGATEVKHTLSSHLQPPCNLKGCIIVSAGRRSAFISNPTIIANECEEWAQDGGKQFRLENRLSFLTLARLSQQQERGNAFIFQIYEKALTPLSLLWTRIKTNKYRVIRRKKRVGILIISLWNAMKNKWLERIWFLIETSK